jgi:hypothetical protein
MIENIKVSPQDVGLLSAFDWVINNKGYARTRQKHNGQHLFLHKIVAERMGLRRNSEVDHIDNNPLNNTRINLREADRSQQCANRRMSAHNTSGFKGVSFDKRRKANPWKAVITIDRKYISLGSFSSPEAAARAYDEAAVKQWGAYAKTNAMLGLV